MYKWLEVNKEKTAKHKRDVNVVEQELKQTRDALEGLQRNMEDSNTQYLFFQELREQVSCHLGCLFRHRAHALLLAPCFLHHLDTCCCPATQTQHNAPTICTIFEPFPTPKLADLLDCLHEKAPKIELLQDKMRKVQESEAKAFEDLQRLHLFDQRDDAYAAFLCL